MSVTDRTPDLPGRLGVAVQLLAHAGKAGGRGELTPTRLTTLAVMSAAGPMRMGGLASRLGVQVSTMSRIVDVMVASGWAPPAWRSASPGWTRPAAPSWRPRCRSSSLSRSKSRAALALAPAPKRLRWPDRTAADLWSW